MACVHAPEPARGGGLKRKRSIVERSFHAGEQCLGSSIAPAPRPTAEPLTYLSDDSRDSIIVAIDGAFGNNVEQGPQASIGVFFHRDSPRNRAECFPAYDDKLAVSQRAQLLAAGTALEAAASMRQRNPFSWRSTTATAPFRRVIIKADSDYIAEGVASWTYKWKHDGARRAFDVVNSDLFELIDVAIEELNNLGVEVQFWHVPRAWNQEADFLSKAALSGVSASEAIDEWFYGA